MLRNAQFLGGFFWFLIGAYVTWAGRELGLGHLHEPGSGFALFWIGLLMCALSATVIGQALRRGSESLASLWQGTRWQKILLVVVLLLVFGAMFETIGFVACSLVLLLVLMWFVDPVDWRVALLVAFGATFGIWYALTKWLQIQLPAGVLASWLG